MQPVVKANLPSEECLKKAIKRVRHDIQAPPVNPVSRAEIILPDQFQRTLGDQNFLIFDSGFGDDNRILISVLLKTSNC